MQMVFSEEERRYIYPEPGNWRVRDDCPVDIRKTLKVKLESINESKRKADEQLMEMRAKHLQRNK